MKANSLAKERTSLLADTKSPRVYAAEIREFFRPFYAWKERRFAPPGALRPTDLRADVGEISGRSRAPAGVDGSRPACLSHRMVLAARPVLLLRFIAKQQYLPFPRAACGTPDSAKEH